MIEIEKWRRWQEACWLLAALLAPLFVNFWVEQPFEASKVWLLRSLIWVFALLWLAGLLMGQQPRALPSTINRLVFLLLLIMGLATYQSANQFIALFGSLERANGFLTQASYLLFFFCVATLINAESSRQLLRVILFTAVPICLLGLVQAIGWQPFPLLTDARSPITTTLGRANFTGAYLAMLLPLTLSAALTAAARRQRFFYWVLLVTSIAVIVLTQARAAWIAAAAGCILYLWLLLSPAWSRRARWLSAFGGVTLLTAGLLLLLQYGLAAGGSIAARLTIWKGVSRLLWPRIWLGYGADTLELQFPAIYPPELVYYQGRGVIVDRAHNWLLDLTHDYGLAAALIFSLLVLYILHCGWKLISEGPTAADVAQNEKPLERHWIAACMAGVCAQLAGNLFLFEVVATSILFWLFLAIISAASLPSKKLRQDYSLPMWLRVPIAGVFILFAAWAILQSNLSPLLADAHSWRGTKALNEGRPLEALAEYESAVTWQPKRAAYYVAAALTAAQINRFEQAERAMSEAIALRPTDPLMYSHLAAIYVKSGDGTPQMTAPAFVAFDKAIELGPTIGLTYQQYADFALRSGELELAQQLAQRAVDLDATDGLSYGILGWLELNDGNLSEAEMAFKQALKWQPDSADDILGLATIYYQQGRYDEARLAVQRSLALDPHYAPALTMQLQLEDK